MLADIREWSIVTIHNLCDGNIAVQESVAAFNEVKGLTEETKQDMTKMGMTASVTEDGKIKVEKIVDASK